MPWSRMRCRSESSIKSITTPSTTEYRMSVAQSTGASRTSGSKATAGRLFVLDVSGGRILSMRPDGSDRTVIVTGCRHPDGIVVDVEACHIYWTDMGVPNLNDGSIQRADIDGLNRDASLSDGPPLTPMQLHLQQNQLTLHVSH